MFVRIIKPAPEGIYLAPQECVIVNQGGSLTVDYIAKAESVQDGVLEIMKDGVKVGEQPAYRMPTDDELKARHPDALYICKEIAPGQLQEVKAPPVDYVFAHTFAGWEQDNVAKLSEEGK